MELDRQDNYTVKEGLPLSHWKLPTWIHFRQETIQESFGRMVLQAPHLPPKQNISDNSNNNQNDNNNSNSSDDKPSSGTDKKDVTAPKTETTHRVYGCLYYQFFFRMGLIITVKKAENLNS